MKNISLKLSVKDQEFQDWQKFLLKQMCSIYQIPIEYFIGLPTGQYKPGWLFRKLQSLFN